MSSEIYVNSQELQRVYEPLRDWLVQNASLETNDGREITGTHLGLPVVEGFAPDHAFSLDPLKARQHAPLFADAFEIGSTEIALSYDLPCYYTNDYSTAAAELIEQGLAYKHFSAGALRVSVKNSDTSMFHSRTLKINSHDETFLIDRVDELSIPGSPCVEHQECHGVNPGEPNSITHKEYLGLVALTDMLHTQGSAELQQAPGWEQNLPGDFRP